MIGRCAAEAHVVLAGDARRLLWYVPSCLACGPKQQTARQWLVSAMERHTPACAFATLTCQDHVLRQVRQAPCRVVR